MIALLYTVHVLYLVGFLVPLMVRRVLSLIALVLYYSSSDRVVICRVEQSRGIRRRDALLLRI